MIIYLMRHGIAEERDAARYPDDDLRPLTPEGERRTRSVAQGMAALDLTIERIVSSPLVRARQTAEIVADMLQLSERAIRETPALSPDCPPGDILTELKNKKTTLPVLLVGHEPHLSQLVSLLLTGRINGARIEFKKAGLAGIECPEGPAAGKGVLQFFLKPGQLVAIGDR